MQVPKPPEFDVQWFRFPKHPSASLKAAFKKPKAFAVYGNTEEGKSAIVENIGSRYPLVIDAFGSRDNEGLGWCRTERKDAILFLRGDGVKVNSNWADMGITEFTKTPIKEFEKYKAIVSVAAFYSSIREEWYALAKLMEKLWDRTSWDEPWCVCIREAANLLYSRMSIGDSQTDAKNQMIYVIREMRHCGFALALDSIRWFSIDVDVRTIADYTFLKGQGIEGLPSSLHFLYSYFEPFGVMKMSVENFILMSRKGPLAFGSSTLPYWHKLEKERFLELFNIDVRRGQAPDYGRGPSHVGDYGHLKMIELRHEKRLGFNKIAEMMGVSSRTPYSHVQKHNHLIEATGVCDRCSRVGGPYAKVTIY